jgi:hypothetical protein
MQEQFLIFGGQNTQSRTRKGLHLTVNFRHGNAYLSADLKNKVFGDNAKHGKLLIICSQIEKNWYLAKSNDPTTGFECKLNDSEVNTSIRINGAQKVFENMAKSMNVEAEKYSFNVSDTPIEFNGLNLYKITKL